MIDDIERDLLLTAFKDDDKVSFSPEFRKIIDTISTDNLYETRNRAQHLREIANKVNVKVHFEVRDRQGYVVLHGGPYGDVPIEQALPLFVPEEK
jgi:hypothetical protein